MSRDLILTVLGALLGFLLPYLVKAFYYLTIISKKYHLEGPWFGYYYNFESGKPVLREETWIIMKGFKNKLVIKAASSTNKSTYTGYIVSEGNYMVVHLYSDKHKEEIFFRFISPIPTNDEVIIGLWCAVDFNRIAAVGPQILSRQKLSEQELVKLLGKIEVVEEFRIMRILDMI